jgi:hypothetical protein
VLGTDKLIISTIFALAENVAGMGEEGTAYIVLLGQPEGIGQLASLIHIGERIILKSVL